VTTFVIRDGKLVERDRLARPGRLETSTFPAPAVSRMTSYESPVTGKDITSWRERERDMDAAGAVDPRDLPRKPFEKRKEFNERSRPLAPEWR
jgi:hypothetical protein